MLSDVISFMAFRDFLSDLPHLRSPTCEVVMTVAARHEAASVSLGDTSGILANTCSFPVSLPLKLQ